jgi:putative ABC transport system substrate-binding protein
MSDARGSPFGRRILLASALAAPLIGEAAAQALPAKMRLAFLSPAPDSSRGVFTVFRKRLAELGWVEGRTLELTFYFAGGSDPKRMAQLAQEIATARPDVILADGYTALKAMADASKSIPIVSIASDPVFLDYAANFGRPGGNVTGVSILAEALNGKRLELLLDLAPSIRTIALVYGVTEVERMVNLEKAAAGLGLRTTRLHISSAADVQNVLTAAALSSVDALAVTSEPLTDALHASIVQQVALTKKPAVYPDRAYTAAGGLMSYGFDVAAVFRRLASYVDRVVRGEKPSDMPIEHPNEVELVINLRTAKSLDLAVSHTFLTRATDIIE